MNEATLNAHLRPHGLAPLGWVQTPPLGKSVALIGPQTEDFWALFTQSAEWQDNKPDPLDRWSERILTALAEKLGAQAHFPFGADSKPFLSWAMSSNTAWQSPVGMLVHATAGLLVSYRGALEFDEEIAFETAQNPCRSCAAPCIYACPVGALTPQGYDVTLCRDYLKTNAGASCLNNGCKVRHACPISQTYPRTAQQSAYHMQRFTVSPP